MSQYLTGRPSLIAGFALIAIGAVALHQATGLEFGTWARVGAGAFPLIVSVLILLGGVAIVTFAFLPGEIALVLPPGLLRASAGMFGAIIVFALTIERLGLVPAVALCALISSLAAPKINWRHVIALGLLLPLAAWLIFVVGLGLRVPPFA